MTSLIRAPELRTTVFQMPHSWHDGGLFMGMHWLWWFFWIATGVLLLWALWRAVSERRTTHERSSRREAAEEELRSRFARDEIDEEEFRRKMQVLREARPENGG